MTLLPRKWIKEDSIPESSASLTVRVLIVESGPDGTAPLLEGESAPDLDMIRARSLSEGIYLLKNSRPDWILLDPNCRSAHPDDLISFLRHAAGIPMLVVSAVETELRLNTDFPQATTASPLDTRIRALAAKVVSHAEVRRKEATAITPPPASVPSDNASSLRQRSPETFEQLVQSYRDFLGETVHQLPFGRPEGNPLQFIVHRLEEHRARPKDVVDVHLTAIRAILAQVPPQSARVYLKEGQTILLKVMGHLANQYLQASISSQGKNRSNLTAISARGFKRRSVVPTS